MRRRKYFIAAMLGIGMILFAGCGGGKDGESVSEAVNDTETPDEAFLDYDVEEYVTLGEYKGLSVKYPVPSVTEEDIQMSIDDLIYDNTQYNEIKDRAAQNGDYLNIDFKGTLNGEEFDGGSDEGYEFTLGEGEFLEDFEKNVLGKKAGETAELQMTFPEDYDEELGGKEVTFSVKINSISEVVTPEYTDAFVAEVTDFDSTKAYEASLQEELMGNAAAESQEAAGGEALSLAIANASINGYPQGLYDACHESVMATYEEYAMMFGMELDEMIADAGEDGIQEEVMMMVNETLVSQAIAKKEGFEITAENYAKEAEELGIEYGYETLSEFLSDYGKASVMNSLVRDKAVAFLYENAKVEEVSEEEYYQDDEALDEIEEEGTEELLEEGTE